MSDPKPEQSQPESDPKILVDEDWKSQVEAEKHAFDEAGQQPEDAAAHADFPEASFAMLVTTLATQATMALVQSMTPEATETPVDFGLAKHLIDTLSILDEKTKGNLTPEESGMMTSVLHQLRMLYVAMQGEVKNKPEKPSSIELP